MFCASIRAVWDFSVNLFRSITVVAAAILAAVEGGILPPGNVWDEKALGNYWHPGLSRRSFRRAGSPALRQAGCPPLHASSKLPGPYRRLSSWSSLRDVRRRGNRHFQRRHGLFGARHFAANNLIESRAVN